MNPAMPSPCSPPPQPAILLLRFVRSDLYEKNGQGVLRAYAISVDGGAIALTATELMYWLRWRHHPAEPSEPPTFSAEFSKTCTPRPDPITCSFRDSVDVS
jgi:hypothetical protein